jgi:hypothetical protein
MPRTPGKPPRPARKPDAAALAAALNLGPKSAAWLLAAGIRDLGAVRRLGAVRAFLKVRARQPRASLNLLWALAGALEGCRFDRLPAGLRSALLMELDARSQVIEPEDRAPRARRTATRRSR